MDVAALILWILTASGGFYLLATWVSKGGARRARDDAGGSRFPAPVIFGHFLLAAVGLVLWIVYVANDKDGFGWTAFVLLLVVALLGFTMLALWIPTYRARRAAGAVETAAGGPAERHFPVAVVAGHGLLAATTLTLVLLALLDVGGS